MHWIALPLPWCDEPAATPGAAEHAAAAGWWALRFTPRVALVDGDTVLLEVSTTERLWGGRDALLAQVLQAWADASVGLPDHPATREAGVPPPGTQAVWGCGPTALVAQAWLRMAQAGRAPSGHNVEGLPLHTLTALRPHVASLERMGCRTWGGLRALPRAGVARRFGAKVLRVLDQALGDAPEAHAWLELPEQFALTAELPALAESADALLWSASRCLAALQGWLQARQQGALALDLAWRHDLRRSDGVASALTQALPGDTGISPGMQVQILKRRGPPLVQGLDLPGCHPRLAQVLAAQAERRRAAQVVARATVVRHSPAQALPLRPAPGTLRAMPERKDHALDRAAVALVR